MKILQTSYNFNNLPVKTNTYYSNINFNGTPVGVTPAKSKFFEPVKKFFKPMMDAYNKSMDKFAMKLAKTFGKLLELKPVEKIVERTKNWDLVSHLSVFTSVVLSGFYIQKTLENKKLDEHRKMTLAINQGIVCLFSGALAYTFDKISNKKTGEFIEKFKNINAGDANLSKYVDGINAAKKIMIFGFIYRFISPVIATPIANSIGNKLQEKNEAELAAKELVTNK